MFWNTPNHANQSEGSSDIPISKPLIKLVTIHSLAHRVSNFHLLSSKSLNDLLSSLSKCHLFGLIGSKAKG